MRKFDKNNDICQLSEEKKSPKLHRGISGHMFENMKISGSCCREIYTLTRCYPLSDSASCFRNSAEIQALKGTASRIWYTITGQFNRICVILMRFTIIKNLYFCMISMQVKTKYLLMPIALCQILSEYPQNNGACHGWS